MGSRMKVSVAMIVKNEERTLGRCLASLAGQVDEIVVVDTGSTDATRQIAGGYTDRIFDFPWRQDFAAARQYAFDRASGDWVFWLDADDVAVGAAAIRRSLANLPSDLAGYYWRYVVDRDAWGNARCEFWRERLVRNDGSFHWVGRVHEVLVSDHPRQLARSSDVVVEHRPEAHRGAEKLRRNVEILESELRDQGEAATPRLLYYLGREYGSAGETSRALAAFERYLAVATWDDERYFAQLKIAELSRAERRYDAAIDAAFAALRICPHWPDAHFDLARTYYFLRDWHKVIHWTEVGRAMSEPDTLQIVNPLDYRFNWIIYYTNALYHVGAVDSAKIWTRRALEICPDDRWHRANLTLFGDDVGAVRQFAAERVGAQHG